MRKKRTRSDRPSPSEPSKYFPHEQRRGNDGKMWLSKNYGKIFRWIRVPDSPNIQYPDDSMYSSISDPKTPIRYNRGEVSAHSPMESDDRSEPVIPDKRQSIAIARTTGLLHYTIPGYNKHITIIGEKDNDDIHEDEQDVGDFLFETLCKVPVENIAVFIEDHPDNFFMYIPKPMRSGVYETMYNKCKLANHVRVYPIDLRRTYIMEAVKDIASMDNEKLNTYIDTCIDKVEAFVFVQLSVFNSYTIPDVSFKGTVLSKFEKVIRDDLTRVRFEQDLTVVKALLFTVLDWVLNVNILLKSYLVSENNIIMVVGEHHRRQIAEFLQHNHNVNIHINVAGNRVRSDQISLALGL